MLDRRAFLIAGGAAMVFPAAAVPAGDGAEERTAATAELYRIFEDMEKDRLDREPERVTSLGLDVGPRAGAKALLNDRSQAALEERRRLNENWARRLHSVSRDRLSAADQVSYDTILYLCEQARKESERFDFAVGSPYAVNQMSAACIALPEFIAQQHRIEAQQDAETYLSRMRALVAAIDQETQRVHHDAGLGVVAPDFILDKTLAMIRSVRAVPAESCGLVRTLQTKTREKGLQESYGREAAKIYAIDVIPAMDRQIALLEQLRKRATSDAGVWRFKDGAAYYQMCLRQQTTTDDAPAAVAERGAQLVAELSSQLDALLKSHGRTTGTVGERLRALASDAAFVRPNTDVAKEQIVTEINARIAEIGKRLPEYFKTLPKAQVVAKRVPQSIEQGAPQGFYDIGSLDGTRPGVFYVNLRDTAELPTWRLPTLTYHESVPGHHLHGSLQQESQLPLIRKTLWTGAFNEGWSLYAEQLADEMGMHQAEPFGRIGYLHDALFRAARLVADTGIHAKRWTRAQATQYFVDTLGMPEAAAVTEIERYCVAPGQACSYMAGKLAILRLREQARTALGQRFDIREFHDAVLLSGSVPLDVLSSIVDRFIAAH